MKKMFALFSTAFFLAAFSAQAQSAGNVAAGEKKAAMCIGCHGIVGYQASFPQVHKVPMISGQNAKYIEASLVAYQKGERKHPTMQGIAASLTEQDMADLSAFYEQHGAGAAPAAVKPSAAPSELVAGLLQKGACVSCHGADFNKPTSAAYPKLAGQHPDYLYVALKAYQTTGHATVGRANAVMAGQVAMFNKDELKALAQYLGSLPAELQVVPQSRFRLKAP